MKISFYNRDNVAYIRITHNRSSVRRSLGLSYKKLSIDTKNKLISKLYALFYDNNNIPLSNLLDIALNITPDESLSSIMQYVITNRPELSYNTIKIYNQSIKIVKSMDNNLLQLTHNQLLSRLLKYGALNGLDDNYINNVIKCIKASLKFNRTQLNGKYYDIENIKYIDKEKELFSLSLNEFNKLLNNIDNEKLDNVRRLFLIQFYTCTRYSELESVLYQLTLNNDYLDITLTKTNSVKRIPVYNAIKSIDLPYLISSQKYNKYLKELFKLLNINSIITKQYYYNNKLVTKQYYLYELASSHLARRSFITLSLSLGINSKIVKDISGIKKWNTFQRYEYNDKSIISQELNNVYHR